MSARLLSLLLLGVLSGGVLAAPPDGLPAVLHGDIRHGVDVGAAVFRWVDTPGCYRTYLADGVLDLVVASDLSISTACGWVGTFVDGVVPAWIGDASGGFRVTGCDWGTGWVDSRTWPWLAAGVGCAMVFWGLLVVLRFIIGCIPRAVDFA